MSCVDGRSRSVVLGVGDVSRWRLVASENDASVIDAEIQLPHGRLGGDENTSRSCGRPELFLDDPWS